MGMFMVANQIPLKVRRKQTPDNSPSSQVSIMNLEENKISESNPSIRPNTTEKEKPFALSPEKLSELISTRDVSAFYDLGGLDGLESGLQTDRRSGLSVDEVRLGRYTSLRRVNHSLKETDAEHFFTEVKRRPESESRSDHFAHRKQLFGDNTLPVRKPPNILRLMWMTYNDYVLFLLTAAAVVSLGVGLFQALTTTPTPNNPPVEWVQGVAIVVAIVIIVVVGAVNDYQKQDQFRRLNQKKQDRKVKVIRSGRSREIPISDVVVGDVVHIEPGDILPADGVLIQGDHIRSDESSVTGESGLSAKYSGDDVFNALQEHKDRFNMDAFLISGTKVLEGVGTFLVTATGTNSSHGRILLSLREEPEFTPLQVKLNWLAKQIARFGGATALLLFIALFIKFLVSITHSGSDQTPAEKGQLFLRIFIIALTVLVIAVPEGLPLAVTLALAFATTKMLRDNNLVRVLKSCETVGNATTICSDKTGTLTQNKMMVVAGTIGYNSLFSDRDSASLPAIDPATAIQIEGVPTAECVQRLSGDVKSILKQSITINSSAFEDEDGSSFIGSRTESALLMFARDYLGMRQLDVERSNARIVRLYPFDGSRQCMITVVQLGTAKYRAYIKGASEVLLAKCTKVIEDPAKGLQCTEMVVGTTQYLGQIIATYAATSMRTISLVYRDFEHWPPTRLATDIEPECAFEDILQDLVFLGILAIRDPLRTGAREAVRTCQTAGVVVRMVTGDNILTAKAVAGECGILSSDDDIAMEGREFRELSQSQRDEIIPRLKVLARSSPEDKQALVVRLKEMGETVAVTGDGTNDALALTAADVGFSMGISGTEVAREASSIVLMTDDFSSIVKAIMWGRAINDAVKKFLQFQITVSITSVGLAFVSAVANSDERSVLTAVQLMWINLFQDTLAALALATDPPPRKILDRNPDPKSAPLITISMWKMIIGQSIYQLAVTLILYFRGAEILSYHTAGEKQQLQTAIFNTYVFMQIFNINRQLDGFNIFEGVFRNWLFIAISLIMIGGQILITFVGGQAFSIVTLSPAQWAYSVILGALSIAIGCIIRVIPDKIFERLIDAGSRTSLYVLNRLRLRRNPRTFLGIHV
ncbi:hypothetical protein Egran_01773 [Elaphomyces granulatus]|uniref:Calcium-transporting ATPase n=1 Tax=Elaphomyces granulatus TaxID=519963 RepID=A0A232M286_9EURO|nr:hypothetical protein Egran_01773 [Elaphomyces granulatus]